MVTTLKAILHSNHSNDQQSNEKKKNLDLFFQKAMKIQITFIYTSVIKINHNKL